MKYFKNLSIFFCLLIFSCGISNPEDEYLGLPIIYDGWTDVVITYNNGVLTQWEKNPETGEPSNPVEIKIKNPIHAGVNPYRKIGWVVTKEGEVFDWLLSDPNKLNIIKLPKLAKKYYEYPEHKAVLFTDGTVMSSKYNTGIMDTPVFKKGKFILENIVDIAANGVEFLACNQEGDLFHFHTSMGKAPIMINSDDLDKITRVRNSPNFLGQSGFLYAIDNNDFIRGNPRVSQFDKTHISDRPYNFDVSGYLFDREGKVEIPISKTGGIYPTLNEETYFAQFMGKRSSYKDVSLEKLTCYSIGTNGSFQYFIVEQEADKKSQKSKWIYGDVKTVDDYKFNVNYFQ